MRWVSASNIHTLRDQGLDDAQVLDLIHAIFLAAIGAG
jgi:alkylhydroperoxidase family enzyme